MAGFGMINKITTKQVQAINALLVSSSVVEAAHFANIPERTIRRWLTQPDFVQALNRGQGEIIENAGRYLISLEIQAIQTLRNLLTDSTQPGASIRLRTAVSILEISSEYYKRTKFEERLTNLERILNHENA